MRGRKPESPPTGPVRISREAWQESYNSRARQWVNNTQQKHRERFGHEPIRRESNGGCLICHKLASGEVRRRRGATPRDTRTHVERYGHDKVPRKGKRYDCLICHRLKARKPPRPSHESRYGHPRLARRTKSGCATCHAMREAGVRPKDKAAREYANLILNDPCAYCGGVGEEFDHIYPVCQGGVTEADNLARACRHCNRTKQARSLLWFLATRKAA